VKGGWGIVEGQRFKSIAALVEGADRFGKENVAAK
jgi:hypothetical protein